MAGHPQGDAAAVLCMHALDSKYRQRWRSDLARTHLDVFKSKGPFSCKNRVYLQVPY